MDGLNLCGDLATSYASAVDILAVSKSVPAGSSSTGGIGNEGALGRGGGIGTLGHDEDELAIGTGVAVALGALGAEAGGVGAGRGLPATTATNALCMSWID